MGLAVKAPAEGFQERLECGQMGKRLGTRAVGLFEAMEKHVEFARVEASLISSYESSLWHPIDVGKHTLSRTSCATR
eukprot:422645-Prymnesium_polylepis.2